MTDAPAAQATSGALAGSHMSGSMDANLRDSRVLIVDDSKFNRQILARFVGWAGVHQIDFAADGVEGLEKVESFKPHLILVDYGMPRMGGIEMTQKLRQNPNYVDLPILMQTTLNSDQQRVACFNAGATDILSMPINPGECIARVRLHLEKMILFHEMRTFRERVESELKLARAMQAALVPDARKIAKLIEPRGLQMESLFEPSSELGGDFWNIFDYSDTALGVINVDFSGHGINAAINTFRLHTIIERTPVKGRMPGEWLAEVNAGLKDVLPMGQFATAFFGIFDTATDLLTYAGSGAPSPVFATERKDIVLSSISKPICNVPVMQSGSAARDGGFLILNNNEKQELVDGNPSTNKYFSRFISGDDFINNVVRWCIWLKNVSPKDFRDIKEFQKRFKSVKEFREQSTRYGTKKMAELPYLFAEERQPESDFLVIPKVSSENRKYIPIAYLTKEYIVSDKTFVVPNTTLYHFGVLTSSMHMTWMRNTSWVDRVDIEQAPHYRV